MRPPRQWRFWSVDNGDPASEIKCTGIRFSAAGGETVVVPGSTVQPRAWLFFAQASVCQLPDGSVLIRRVGCRAQHHAMQPGDLAVVMSAVIETLICLIVMCFMHPA